MVQKEHFLALPSYGVLIESHVHGPEFRTIVHSHPYPSLLFVVSGKGHCVINEITFNLLPNTVVILNANQPHQLIDKPRKAMAIFVVYFGQDAEKANQQLVKPLFERQKIMLIPAHEALYIRQALRQMLHEQDKKQVAFELAMQQHLSFILLKLYRLTASMQPSTNIAKDSTDRVQGVLKYISEQYYEPQSLSNAAEMAKLSQRQFSNICRKLMGRDFRFARYVNMLRTQKAAKLLKTTNMPATAVAFEVGFEDLSTFYRAFKKFQGCKPMESR